MSPKEQSPSERRRRKRSEVIPTLVGLGRLERPTSPLSGVRSNHLSYRPSTIEQAQTRPQHTPQSDRIRDRAIW
jgi:hypothetical protein